MRPPSGICKRPPHWPRRLSEAGQIRRGGDAGAYYRLREFRGRRGHRIPEGGAGLRNRLQDIYDRGACDPLWHCGELGAWPALLGWAVFWGILKEYRDKDRKSGGADRLCRPLFLEC